MRRFILAAVILLAATTLLGGLAEAQQPPVANVAPHPPPGGFVQFMSGTADIEALIGAQTFTVASVWRFNVSTQGFGVYIPGAPSIVNTLVDLRVNDIVTIYATVDSPIEPVLPSTRPSESQEPLEGTVWELFLDYYAQGGDGADPRLYPIFLEPLPDGVLRRYLANGEADPWRPLGAWTAAGTEVEFSFVLLDVRFTGTRSGDSMVGVLANSEGLSSNWVAVRVDTVPTFTPTPTPSPTPAATPTPTPSLFTTVDSTYTLYISGAAGSGYTSTAGNAVVPAWKSCSESGENLGWGSVDGAPVTVVGLGTGACAGWYLLYSEEKAEAYWASPFYLAATPPIAAAPSPSGGSAASAVIETCISGTFEGWTGDTLFELCNGQVWIQSSYDYEYHYAYRPDVTIVLTSSGYQMFVEGVSDSVGVTQVTDFTKTCISGTFEGWTGDTLFELCNGQVWIQSSYDYEYHYAYRPDVTIVLTSSGYQMFVEGVSDSVGVMQVTDFTKTCIASDFEGFQGDSVFTMCNGQVWQQSTYTYTYRYAYRPDALIYRSPLGGGYKMKVEGIDRTIGVVRIR